MNYTIHIDELVKKITAANNSGYTPLVVINGEYYNIVFPEDAKEKEDSMETKVKEFLVKYGYGTFTRYAEALGENVSNVHKVLIGKQKPKVQKLIKWATITGCSIEELLELIYPDEMREYLAGKEE